MKQRRLNFYSLVVFGCIASCNSVDTPPCTEVTTITGTVKDATTGIGIVNTFISTEPNTETVLTDGNGEYLIDVGVSVGQQYQINAEQPDYLPDQATIRVQGGRNQVADISLTKASPQLGVSPPVLDIGTRNSSLLTVSNVGNGGHFTWTLNLPNESWISADKHTGVIEDNVEAITISVDRTGLCNQEYETQLSLTADNGAGSATITVRMSAPNEPDCGFILTLVEPTNGATSVPVQQALKSTLPLHR